MDYATLRPKGVVPNGRFKLESAAGLLNTPSEQVLRSRETPTAKRIGFELIFRFFRRYPNALQTIVTKPYTEAGYTVVGYGSNSIALTIDTEPDQITKVHRHTAGHDHATLVEIRDRLAQEQTILTTYLGAYTVPQVFEVGSHPLESSCSVLLSRQERISDGDPVNLHQDSDVPGAKDFAAYSLDMHKDTSLLPDILGRDNLFQTPNGLKLIDTLPLTPDGLYTDKTLEILNRFTHP